MALKKNISIEKIKHYFDQGFGTNEIARLLDCEPSTITYHKRRLGFKIEERPTYDWGKIQIEYDSGLSLRDVAKKYKMSLKTLTLAVRKGSLITRSIRKAIRLLSDQGKLRGACSLEYLGTEKHRQSSSRGGGYKERSGCSKGAYIVDSFGFQTYLQSSFEISFSELLDQLEISWIRPKPLVYSFEGKLKKYYPDFYLTDYDIFVDTKNDYLIKKDKKKIGAVRTSNPNINLVIVSKKNINEIFIKNILCPDSTMVSARGR